MALPDESLETAPVARTEIRPGVYFSIERLIGFDASMSPQQENTVTREAAVMRRLWDRLFSGP